MQLWLRATKRPSGYFLGVCQEEVHVVLIVLVVIFVLAYVGLVLDPFVVHVGLALGSGTPWQKVDLC